MADEAVHIGARSPDPPARESYLVGDCKIIAAAKATIGRRAPRRSIPATASSENADFARR
jgi:acetyl/propionyl-CoA carboxylase alpha subunit